MADLVAENFKKWLIKTGKTVSTASGYLSGLKRISNHAKQNILEISNVDKLSELYRQYGLQGEHSVVGATGNGSARAGLKQWLEYQKQTQSGITLSSSSIKGSSLMSPPLNQILYGPPGTGKTYETIKAALDILDPEFSLANADNRAALKSRFDELLKNDHIRFVTFHQSFSYEDFVEGLRAETDEANGQIRYNVVDGVFKSLCELAAEQVDAGAAEAQPRVLIIDEINRGNISRIFGELITLIEPSKRADADEALEVILPYSKKPFSVPSNLYLIGTMNTSDRSLAGLDIALRRRFTFKEMPPRPELLDEVFVEGISIGQLLRVMNQRIEVLLGRDYCLGHAYFMELASDESKCNVVQLALIFRQKILPLLQEYFFEDWQRIGWVLNDQNSPSSQAFVRQPASERSLVALFGATVADSLSDRRWELNDSAFDDIDSYANIIGKSGE